MTHKEHLAAQSWKRADKSLLGHVMDISPERDDGGRRPTAYEFQRIIDLNAQTLADARRPERQSSMSTGVTEAKEAPPTPAASIHRHLLKYRAKRCAVE
jgi:hypothetical protein